MVDHDGVKNALKAQPTIDVHTFLINKGRAFNVPVRIADTANNDSIFVFVENPANSGFDYDIALMARATGRADINISFGASKEGANDTTAHNLKSGSNRSFSGTAATFNETDDTGTSPSHGTTVIQDFVPGTGAGAPNLSAQVIDAIVVTIDEGDNKLFELNNGSGGQLARMALNLTIFEVDGTYKEVT
jgi:hypothetical protein